MEACLVLLIPREVAPSHIITSSCDISQGYLLSTLNALGLVAALLYCDGQAPGT